MSTLEFAQAELTKADMKLRNLMKGPDFNANEIHALREIINHWNEIIYALKNAKGE